MEKKTQTYTKIDTLYCRYQKIKKDNCPNPKWLKFSNKIILGHYANPLFGYLQNNMFEAYSKIDGTNSKIVYYPSSGEIIVGGKSDNANSQHGQFEYLQAIADRIKPILGEMYPKESAVFTPKIGDNKKVEVNHIRIDSAEFDTVEMVESPIYIYGEYYGCGIQKCGGNYSKENRFAVFDICQNGWWIPSTMRHGICQNLEIEEVPRHFDMTLKAAEAKVMHGFTTCVNDVVNDQMIEEGLVLRPTTPFKDSRGNRVIVKIKYCDYQEWSAVRKEFTDEEFEEFNRWYFSNIEDISEDELNHIILSGTHNK